MVTARMTAMVAKAKMTRTPYLLAMLPLKIADLFQYSDNAIVRHAISPTW
jgi:hypothetical protein